MSLFTESLMPASLLAICGRLTNFRASTIPVCYTILATSFSWVNNVLVVMFVLLDCAWHSLSRGSTIEFGARPFRLSISTEAAPVENKITNYPLLFVSLVLV